MAIIESATRDALLVLRILKLIPRNHWISTPEIKQALEESGYAIEPRRLQRILRDIHRCEDLHVECNTAGKPYGYRRIPDTDLASAKLTPQESLLLRLAEEHLKYQVPARIMSALTPLFESARHALNETSAASKQNAWMQKVAFVPDSIALMPPTILMRIFDSVSEALYRDSKLDIEYQNVSGECKKRTVSPLGLVQQEHRLYLICKFNGYDDIRHLALHRIKTAEVLDFAADRPQDFRLQEYIAQRHVNYSNGGKVHFIVEFTNPVTKTILEETPFNRTQTIESLPDGAWRLEAIMDDTVLLDGWVAAWKTTAGIRRVEKKPIK